MSISKSKKRIKIDQNEVKGVVNVKKEYLIKNGYIDFADWASRKDNLYIGRNMDFYVPGAIGSIWQNPYPVLNPKKKYKDTKKRYTLDESLDLYEKYVLANPDLMDRLSELIGKTVGCWCKGPNGENRCHGDILTKLVKEYCN